MRSGAGATGLSTSTGSGRGDAGAETDDSGGGAAGSATTLIAFGALRIRPNPPKPENAASPRPRGAPERSTRNGPVPASSTADSPRKVRRSRRAVSTESASDRRPVAAMSCHRCPTRPARASGPVRVVRTPAASMRHKKRLSRPIEDGVACGCAGGALALAGGATGRTGRARAAVTGVVGTTRMAGRPSA